MGVLVFFCGFGASVVGFTGYLIRPIRDVEEILPDHTQDALTEKRRHLDELLEVRLELLSQPATVDREKALKDISQRLRSLGRST